jgi:phage terminase large subunit-like protein
MVEKVIKDTDKTVYIKLVHATRGKAVRAEPISALTERGFDHLVGSFPALEDQLCLWLQGDKSPNRMDAKVWADTELSSGGALGWDDVRGTIDGVSNKWAVGNVE